MKQYLRTATIYGALPLLSGVAICIAWLVLGRPWLMLAGLMLLPIGLALPAAGAIALFRYWWLARRDPETSFARRWTTILLVAGLFLANFAAVAAAVMLAVANFEGHYVLVVHNSSSVRLDDVRAVGGNCGASFRPIQPGATVRLGFPSPLDPVLTFSASMDGRPIEGYINHYEHVGRHADITVDQGRNVSVRTRLAQQLTMRERLRDVAFWLDDVPCR